MVESAQISDKKFLAEFQAGFEEGRALSGAAVVYVVTLVWEGRDFGSKSFLEIGPALLYAAHHLMVGVDAAVRIAVVLAEAPEDIRALTSAEDDPRP